MSNIVEAGFKIIQERTLPVIASEILQIEENVGRVALDGAIRIGERLKEAKEKVEHGQWENWCRENLNYSKSKTEKLMKIATEYGDENSSYAKTYTCTDLSISKALRLLQVPEDEVEKFVAENPVDDMTVKELEERIRELEQEKTEAKSAADRLKPENEDLKRELEELRAAGVDPEELEKLSAQLEKQKETVKRLKVDLKQEKANREIAVSEALAKEKEAIRDEAVREQEETLKNARAESEELKSQVKQLEEKIEKASNEETLIFKIKADSFQEAFADCLAAALDSDDPEKLKGALRKVMEHMLEELEG